MERKKEQLKSETERLRLVRLTGAATAGGSVSLLLNSPTFFQSPLNPIALLLRLYLCMAFL
ncbi:MAG: hypothetical protein HY268_23605 [Deltaproteobacteria bacterium]|nr:hypothetical protein [Deltaproteobacteria bacterium]